MSAPRHDLIVCACGKRQYLARDAIDAANFRGELEAKWKEFLEAVEADHVVPDLVEEDREAERRLGPGGLDPVDIPAIGIAHPPGAAAHVLSPAAHAHEVFPLHLADNGRKIRHGYFCYRQVIGRSLIADTALHIVNIRSGRRGVTYGIFGFDSVTLHLIIALE